MRADGIMKWFARHPLRPALACIGLIVLLGATSCTSPRTDRDWYPYLARTSHVEQVSERFAVSPVSDWSYNAAGVTDERYGAASYDYAALRNVWFVLEPQPGSKLAAHTLLLFEFENDQLLGLTIEARRERDEDYSALRGVGRAYELAYVWATARDLLIRRAVMLDHEVFVYPVAIDAAQKRQLLTRLLERTAALEARPRFYNTLFSNCTNELAKAAGLDWHPSFILTGRSDEHLFRQGILPGASFEQAHARSDMTQFIKAQNERSGDFDAALLAELRRRNVP
jgi:Domain of unknown function (DUF4105)